ncbi:hypothetical protein FIU85_05055 [Roseovarius sp. THAF8]|uniref:hypothetical protein n=1 Tax=Roseovarius sp. THAF8 TaxID=2587846 RepID=UPI0012A8015D|nr:hypothetical protein [Roseovarius sp. THAF8]QFT96660.1 hypothetical protein FIU85_05055 [Roseovarius sp. THAF8]
MAANSESAHADPSWFVAPGETDYLAWFVVVLLCLAIYGMVVLYAAFDRWAEHQSQGTPLAKTIPTMLTIALLYEIFPLDHFNILLPLSAILIALMADWARFNLGHVEVGLEGTARRRGKRHMRRDRRSPGGDGA